MTEAIEERLWQTSGLSGDARHFARLRWVCSGDKVPRDSISGLLLAADTPFLPLLHSLVIPGHQPTPLGKFPEGQHEDVFLCSNGV